MDRINAIAIDGLVASGKTVVGMLVAEGLGWRFLDTGSMYRGVTWAAIDQGIDVDDLQKLTDLAYNTRMEVEASYSTNRLLIDGRDVTDQLRTAPVEEAVSQVAKVGSVRKVLVEKQRALGKQGEIVMVGRDIGAVVLPKARLKIFLTASVEERAKRRYQELMNSGSTVSYSQVLENLQGRDKLDTERHASPAKPAEDAEVINTDDLSVGAVVDRILETFEQHHGAIIPRK